jgi:hypothetical protein
MKRVTRVVVCLVVAAAFAAAPATAENITYTFVGLSPISDFYAGGADTISGTIVTDGTLGQGIGASHILGGTLTMSGSSAGNFTTPMPHESMDFTATSTQLLVAPGHGVGINGNGSGFDLDVAYDHTANHNSYYATAWSPLGDPIAGFTAPSWTGPVAGDGSWIVATAAPEPSTLVLLGCVGVWLLFSMPGRQAARKLMGGAR